MTQSRRRSERSWRESETGGTQKKKKVGELDDTELDGISGGEGMDTGKIIP